MLTRAFTFLCVQIKSICDRRNIFRDLVPTFSPVYELRVTFGDKAVVCGEAWTPADVRAFCFLYCFLCYPTQQTSNIIGVDAAIVCADA